jgi:hypothetical protein
VRHHETPQQHARCDVRCGDALTSQARTIPSCSVDSVLKEGTDASKPRFSCSSMSVNTVTIVMNALKSSTHVSVGSMAVIIVMDGLLPKAHPGDSLRDVTLCVGGRG